MKKGKKYETEIQKSFYLPVGVVALFNWQVSNDGRKQDNLTLIHRKYRMKLDNRVFPIFVYNVGEFTEFSETSGHSLVKYSCKFYHTLIVDQKMHGKLALH